MYAVLCSRRKWGGKETSISMDENLIFESKDMALSC